MEYVALRDIQADEEIFLDYGQDWEQAWESHRNQWGDIGFRSKMETTVYLEKLNDEALVLTEKEQRRNPYPANTFTSCYYNYAEAIRRDQRRGKLYMWSETAGTYYDRNLRPCAILDRHEYKGDTIYTVAIRNRYGLDPSQRIRKGEMHIVTLLPRKAIRFSSKIFTTDQHLAQGFRHEIHLKDDIFPLQWKDLS